MGLEFPNLPYLIDGDFTLTETDAIIRYIIKRADRADLLGKNIKDEARVTQILGVIQDALDAGLETCFCPKDKAKEIAATKVEKVLLPKAKLLDEFLGEKSFFLGYITLADFILHQLAEVFDGIDPTILEKCKNLQGLVNRINNIESIKKYLNSTRYSKAFLETFATFCPGKHEDIEEFRQINNS